MAPAAATPGPNPAPMCGPTTYAEVNAPIPTNA